MNLTDLERSLDLLESIHGINNILEYLGRRRIARLVLSEAYDILKEQQDETETEELLERYKERGE